MAKKTIFWLDEEVAARVVKRAPRTLRRKVKSGEWAVAFRTVEGRSYQYSEADLEKVYQYHYA